MQELAQGYYLANFSAVTHRVAEVYADLLSPQELQYYREFHRLQQPAQYLYVRMLMRKGSLFRASKLRYAEIPSRADASRELQDKGFIAIDPALPVSDWLPLFNKSESLQWLAQAGVEAENLRALKASKRAELDQFAAARFAQAEVYQNSDSDQQIGTPADSAVVPAPPETCYQLLDPEAFEVFKLLYFGNPRQDLTDFILRDLAITRFEQYSLARSERLFEQRHQIDQQLAFYRLTAELETILQADAATILQFHQQLPRPAADDARLQRRVQRVTLQLARQLERLQCPQQALQLYRGCPQAPSRERQARILTAEGDIDAALQLCGDMVASPQTDEELEFAQGFAHRTAKKHRLPLEAWSGPDCYQPPQRTLELPRPCAEAEGERVERLAAAWYGRDGECYYVENALFLTLFALVFWDVIYAPVAGGFSHPFQYRPHDLYDEDFLARRRHWYEQARQTFAAEHCPDGLVQSGPLLERYAAKQGVANNLVFWQATSPELLELTLQRVPAADLEKICARLWQDLQHNRNGLPDLIHFPAAGGYRLVEVKAPGDRLQKNQRRWMAWFARQQIPHEVVQIDWC